MNFTPQTIDGLADELDIGVDDLEPYGRGKAKLSLDLLSRPSNGEGRLVLVTAINPTPAGEGKTTVSISLAMGLRRLGKNAVLALREPSLGPVFGAKGGGTGGGKASLTPADDINLHFTGDIHAITTAHNLLSALIDNAIFFREEIPGRGVIDPGQVTWGRALDMNDRALRQSIVGIGTKTDDVSRQEHFDITAASEIMAIMALASGLQDLEDRLSRIVVGRTHSGQAVTAGDLRASGAMTVVLRDALRPNLVQTEEGGPAIVHCGPFGNIAHGCNSVVATRLAMKLGDYAITEAGFGFDLGGEKFLDIKCRLAGIWPRAVVIVVTLRALKMHGGAPIATCGEPDTIALIKGLEHLEHHLATVSAFGLPPIVAINLFPNDTESELLLVEKAVAERGVRFARTDGFARGGEGSMDIARVVSEVVDLTDVSPPQPRFIYNESDSPHDKIRKIARVVYGASDVAFTPTAEMDIARIAELGYSNLPICMAKTHLSLTDDPRIAGRPRNFSITVREVRLSAGAGFLIPMTGAVLTMPGLPRVPASRNIRLLPDGSIAGLMQND
jgi:formate--tetrahydrofolate ligase